MFRRCLADDVSFHILYPRHYRQIVERKQHHPDTVILSIYLDSSFRHTELLVLLVQRNALLELSLQVIHQDGGGIPRQHIDSSALLVYLHIINHGIFTGALSDASHCTHKVTVASEEFVRLIATLGNQEIVLGDGHAPFSHQGLISIVEFHHLQVFHKITQREVDGIFYQFKVADSQFLSVPYFLVCYHRHIFQRDCLPVSFRTGRQCYRHHRPTYLLCIHI